MEGINPNLPLSQQADQIKQQITQELAIANAQELLTKLNEKCFAKCVTSPSSRLDGSEQGCLGKCMDRYMDSWNIVSKAYHSRMKSAMSESGASDGMY